MPARKFMVVSFTLTYCFVVIGSLVLSCLKIIPVDAFIGILAGFTQLCGLIAHWYFNRDDRQTEQPVLTPIDDKQNEKPGNTDKS